MPDERRAVIQDIRSLSYRLLVRASNGDDATRTRIQRRLASLVRDTSVPGETWTSPVIYPGCSVCNQSWEALRSYLREHIRQARIHGDTEYWLREMETHLDHWEKEATP